MSQKNKNLPKKSPPVPLEEASIAGIVRDPILAAIRDQELSQQVVRQTIMKTSHSGPLPPPELLAEYKKFIPDAPERLLALVEREQLARHEHEKFLLESAAKDAEAGRSAHLRGDIITFAIFAACTALGAAILFLGYSQIIAGTLLGAPLIGSLASYLLHRHKGGITPTPTKENAEE